MGGRRVADDQHGSPGPRAPSERQRRHASSRGRAPQARESRAPLLSRARARAPVAESHAWEKPCPPLPVPRPCPIPQLINPRLPEVVASYFPAAPTPPTSTPHPSPHSSLHPILPCTHLCTPPCPYTLTLHLFTVHPSHHCMVSWAPGAESTLAWPPEA